jgi:hypothetical protein
LPSEVPILFWMDGLHLGFSSKSAREARYHLLVLSLH